MKKKITALMLTGVLIGFSYGKELTVSFGNGGFEKYEVIDNTCFSYIMGYPKTDKTVPNIMNEAVLRSIAQAKKKFGKQYDGFINVRVHMQFVDKKMIIYQICGDLVRRK
ncbi:hypothetical protein SAMN06265182_0158 [Persephonella hydrogeniphila]|uniref:Uncharacterized protein n=1 Tax=Persephonella hydrogeniphila TaxID=198703 RepID=A0A285MZG7_9AQUI|nr:hypothetical protein [Persephonella hydrogeniphila]SNZ02589.1 hypothetical protein SAMN06265182_0158 [Persephonella hydrogeniphila]